MFSSAFALLLSGMFLSLRLGTNSGSFPRPLSAEEERAAVDAWVNKGDLEARNKLIEHNLRLVAHIIKKYYAQTAEQEDLISIGTIGLIKGVSTYRPDKNVRLATYASRCIENAMLPQRPRRGEKRMEAQPPSSCRMYRMTASSSPAFCSAGQGRALTFSTTVCAWTAATRFESSRRVSLSSGKCTTTLKGPRPLSGRETRQALLPFFGSNIVYADTRPLFLDKSHS